MAEEEKKKKVTTAKGRVQIELDELRKKWKTWKSSWQDKNRKLGSS